MFSRMLAIGGVSLLLWSCAAPPAEPLTTSHPASADAPEAPLPSRSDTLDVQPEAAAAATSPAGAATKPAAEKVIYACPMHPEVISDHPGKCPKCGMNLRLVTPTFHGEHR